MDVDKWKFDWFTVKELHNVSLYRMLRSYWILFSKNPLRSLASTKIDGFSLYYLITGRIQNRQTKSVFCIKVNHISEAENQYPSPSHVHISVSG